MVNSFHATFDRRADNRGSAPNLFGPQALGITNFADNMPDNYMQITVSNYFNVACGTCAPGYFNVNNYQLSDDFSITKGKHQIGFGFDGRKEQFNSLNNQQSNGQWTFTGSSTVNTGDSLADLELGKLAGLTDGNALSDYIRQTVFAFYVQDTFRATSHLTVNLGARWEPYQPAVDKQCRGNQFSLAEYLAGFHSSQYPAAPAGLLFGHDSPNQQRLRVRQIVTGRTSRRASAWCGTPRAMESRPSAPASVCCTITSSCSIPSAGRRIRPTLPRSRWARTRGRSRILTSVMYRLPASRAIPSRARRSSRRRELTSPFRRTCRWNTSCSGMSVISGRLRRTGWRRQPTSATTRSISLVRTISICRSPARRPRRRMSRRAAC